MSDEQNLLGAFLQARRALVSPEQAGIARAGARRVPGLRREEVAMLAGISADYYLRLERGRDRNPSVQVLESVARVLQLDAEHLEHMQSLAAGDGQRRRKRSRPRRDSMPSGISKLVDTLGQPAFVEDRYFDIVAANPLARALSPSLRVGGNQLRAFFLDPAEQAHYPDWAKMTQCFVANLRQAVGNDVDDPRFFELTGELALASDEFRRLWARHEVRGQIGTPIRITHPQVGDLTLNRERLAISGTDGLMMVVYHADRDSTDAEKLDLLASSVLPTHTPAHDVVRERQSHRRR